MTGLLKSGKYGGKLKFSGIPLDLKTFTPRVALLHLRTMQIATVSKNNPNEHHIRVIALIHGGKRL